MCIRDSYAHSPVTFAPLDPDPDALLPAALFDSVTDNLLQNALLKSQGQSALQVRITLAADASLLRVCDSGSALGEEVLADLLRAPVASASGLGVGLYHAARQAESCGYELRLASNVTGRVCFELRRRSVGDAPAS